MRIDTTLSNTSWFTLGLDIPYRFAYRHIRIAFKEPDIRFFERITHLSTSVLLSVPVLGLVIALAERLLFPPKQVKQPVVKEEPKQQPEVIHRPVEEPAPPVEEAAPIVEEVKKIIRPNLILELVDNKVSVESLTLDELQEIADNGKLWSLLNQSKKKVAEIFTAEHFKILLDNSDIATLDDRIDTLKSIVELIPFDKPSQIEILKIVCQHATPEMELLLQVKVNAVKRRLKGWSIDSSIINKLNDAIKNCSAKALQQRAAKEKLAEKKREKRSQKKYKFHVPLPGEQVHFEPPVNSASPREEKELTDEEFFELLESDQEESRKFQQKGFLYKLLQSYGSSEQQQAIEKTMSSAMESQLTTMLVMNETVSMTTHEIASLVKVLGNIDPQHIITLWDQLLKNNAAFLGEQGKIDNAARIGAVFVALSDAQVNESLEDNKFEIVVRDYPKEAAKNLSPKHLELVSKVIGPEALSELVPSLEEEDSLADTLKVICEQFPKHVKAKQKKIAELDDTLKELDEQKERQKYHLLKSTMDELKSQLITLERVLRVKIKKAGDETVSQELLTLAGL